MPHPTAHTDHRSLHRRLHHAAVQVDRMDAGRREELETFVAALIVFLVAAALTLAPAVRHQGSGTLAAGAGAPSAVAVRTAASAPAQPEPRAPADAPADTPAAASQAPAAPPAPAAAPPAPQPAPVVESARGGALPVGKGMWIWQPEATEQGDAAAIVARATATGLTHLFVRTGSSFDGFYAQGFLDRILPAAHAAGIRVYGWDVPYLRQDDHDVDRALAAITYTTPDGQRLDGFAPDLELGDGQNITPIPVFAYGQQLRNAVGARYPLIACVPRPTPQQAAFPYPEAVAAFDAIAPMVYWLDNDPADTVTAAVTDLSRFGKPVMPVGQAYDGASEGGPPGVPGPDELRRFFQAGDAAGADGYSFWDWQAADQPAWDTIRDAPEGMLPASGTLTAGQARAYQVLLRSLGFATVADFQQATHLPATGRIDPPTRAALLTPAAPPIRPSPHP